jgi:biopolymer transport protein ExbD
MRFRRHHRPDEKVELQMTPMIDIVFQLLIFFMLSFKIAAQEGDFNVKMPRAAPNAARPDASVLPPLRLRLSADETGKLRSNGIQLNERTFSDFAALHQHVRGLIGDAGGPGSVRDAEIEIDCDYHLRYASVIDAVSAVSGYVDEDDNVVKLIEKIKFTPPHNP